MCEDRSAGVVCKVWKWKSKDDGVEVSGSPTEKAILHWGVMVLSCYILFIIFTYNKYWY